VSNLIDEDDKKTLLKMGEEYRVSLFFFNYSNIMQIGKKISGFTPCLAFGKGYFTAFFPAWLIFWSLP